MGQPPRVSPKNAPHPLYKEKIALKPVSLHNLPFTPARAGVQPNDMINQTLYILAQTGQAGPQQNSLTGMLVPFACIGVIFYFLIIRPQSKKQKEQVAMINSIKTGDKVVTSGGIHGLVLNVKETTLMVKIADNVKIEVDKSAVVVVAKRTEESDAAA